MTLIRWRPTRDLMNVQDEMNRVFERFFSKDSWNDEESVNQAGWYPVVDISENNFKKILCPYHFPENSEKHIFMENM